MDYPPVAGIDVGKNFSEMCILSPNNEIYHRIKIYHDSIDSIKEAIGLLQKAEKDFAIRPVVVLESTGHYHKILFHYLSDSGFEVSIINPIQSDSIKNIGIRKVKNDKFDAHKIALLYRFSFIKTTVVPDDVIDCLKSLCRQYYKLGDELTTYKNRLIGIIDQVMLNFTDVFQNVYSNTALAVLDRYPSPKQILKANKQTLISLIEKTSKKGLAWSTEKYELLVLKAKEFKDLSINNPGNLAILKVNISMVRTLQDAQKDILDAINEIILADSLEDNPVLAPIINLLCSIPGIGILTAATILAEVGDFSAFSSPNKLVAFFGIDPSVNQSGEFTGTRNKMSKRGSRLLRRVIFTTALANIRSKRNGDKTNPVLYEFYQKKCTNKPKKVALGAVMRKLVNIIFAVMRDKKPFELRTPEEHEELLLTRSSVA
ncbi:IS110 family transposase [Acidilutibacter cellobiosedens]|jgi:transposase|uniref:IS110 family transposase n=1 Tax=Acidilutibacter cellobiosedens TaxID=2507161 RepID=A0A410Q8M6_9FIRM|nr:IS110 family transposase [Acidilutibacter cellobiosedens]QAT60333.1 IS110 family transposase [Acidilutibacter cellobiosedens]QAT61850.1 IS110 family transposase [Acidilutibacter cellobiosedens]QAT61909.1 IS110 family transposase [Acidilutibacter cellobiosedens]QAT62185.1 IS110 family transposase [Acidilutibacter cellobiosedens]QAT63137.1 IS110 family transposase [Acidilutibacter cellobiosedens]